MAQPRRGRTQPRLRAVVVVAALLATAACGGGGTAAPEQVRVRVAAASDLQYALDELLEGFTVTRPGVRVDVSYGSSGALFQQLANGAPFDLYLAADISYAERLVAEGVTESSEVFPYAVGSLVLWVGDGSPVDPTDGLEAIVDAERVAIANPEHAPYGQAAVAALRSAGVYEAVADRLVIGESVAHAAEFVASGNAEAGIVALSQVRSPPLRELGSWQELPQELYPRLEQGGAVLPDSAAAAEARLLRDYLTGPAGAGVLTRYGFEACEPDQARCTQPDE